MPPFSVVRVVTRLLGAAGEYLDGLGLGGPARLGEIDAGAHGVVQAKLGVAAIAWAGRDAVQSYYRDESDAALSSGRAVLDAGGLQYAVQQEVGDPSVEIARIAESGGYDLIAMGKHGAGAVMTMVIGSVAQKVLARSAVPVLLLGDASR